MRLVPLMALFLIYGGQEDWSEFRRLARDRDPDRRCDAIALIRPRADLPMVQALLPLMADPHARVRKRAAEAVARAAPRECVDFVARSGLRHPQKLIRAHAAECLGVMGDSSASAALIASLSDPDGDVRAAVGAALARLDARESAEKLATMAERDAAWPAKAAALEALGKLDIAAAERIASAASAERAWQVRLSAARVAESLEASAGARIATAAMQDSDWRVRVQAIESACVLRDRAVIGPLVDLLGREAGRLRWDAWRALRELTGKELGLEPAHWKRWWDANRETFEMSAAAPAGEPAGPRPGETGVSFFSIPILSTRTAFVFDLSGSMRDPAPPVPGRGEESKLDVAKREAAATFSKLPESAWINILLLGCDVDGRYEKPQMMWKRTLQPATPRGRADAAAFLNRQAGRGWTNIWDGLELAFEDDLVDTIYLYTDGGASRGAFVATPDILDELARMNRFRKIMIHTVEVPAETPNTADNIRLLKGIAETTKGAYRLAQ